MSHSVYPILLPKQSSSLELLELEYILDNRSDISLKNTTLITSDGFKFKHNALLDNVKDVAVTKNTLFYLSNNTTWDKFVYEGTNSNIIGKTADKKSILDRLDQIGFFYSFIRHETTSTNSYSFLSLSPSLQLSTSDTEKTLVKFTKTKNNKVNITLYSRNLVNEIIEYKLAVIIAPITNLPTLVIKTENEITSADITDFNLNFINSDKLIISFETNIYKNVTPLQRNVIFERGLSDDVIPSPSFLYNKPIGFKDNRLIVAGFGMDIVGDMTNIFKYPTFTKVLDSIVISLVYASYYDLVLGVEDFKQNTWTGYYNEIFDKSHNSDVTQNPNITTSQVPINYLLTVNYNSNLTTTNTLKTNIVSLKTTYTPEQETIKTPTVFFNDEVLTNAPDNLQPIQRQYVKLFVSNYNMLNYDKVHLGYVSGTRELKFLSNKNTYFHYPIQAPALALSASNLIQAGAIPGPTPFLADKIFMKNAAYGDKSVWGHVTPPGECLNGQFLCAWLSGSDSSSLQGLEQSIWVDRWYDSATVTEISALKAGKTQIASNNEPSTIVDIPSQIILNPGGYYYYYHVGNEEFNNYISSFNVGGSSLKLHVKTISENIFLQPKDLSIYNNSITLLNQKNSTLLVTDSIDGTLPTPTMSFDGTNCGKIQYNESFKITNKGTIGFWARSNNWKDNSGYHLLDNSFRGGWGVSLKDSTSNPSIVLGESNYNYILGLNETLGQYTDGALLSSVSGSILPDNIAISEELFTFVLDKNNRVICKFDYNGDIVDLLDLSSITNEITSSKIQFGPNQQLFVKFNNNLLTTTTNFTSSQTIPFNYTNFVIDLSGRVFGGNFIDATVDNYNTIWYISSCPANFFTTVDQPFYNYPFFESSSQISDDTNEDIIEFNNDRNFIFHCTYDQGLENSSPISVVDLNGILVTFSAFFPNNARDGILSKFFNPQKILFDIENYLYVFNDTQELMKLAVDTNNLAGFVFRKPLLDDNYTTGLNLFTLSTSMIALLSSENTKNRYNPDYEYVKLTQTETTWPEVKDFYPTFNYGNLAYEYDITSKTNETFIYYIDNFEKILYKLSSSGEVISQKRPFISFANTEVSNFNFKDIATTYDHFRKFIYKEQQTPIATLTTVKNNIITKHRLQCSTPLVDNEWHYFTLTFDGDSGVINFYVDGVIKDIKQIPTGSEIYYNIMSDIGIGASILKSGSMLEEIKSTQKLFQGEIDDIRIYNYVLPLPSIGRLVLNKYKIHDLVWNLPIGLTNYIEEIQHFYKHRLPGSKSALFNLILYDTGIKDPSIQNQVEEIIKENIQKVIPSHTYLNKIYWQ